MAEQQQFYLLLGNLMSPDNNVRKQSEVSEGIGADFMADRSRNGREREREIGAARLAEANRLLAPLPGRARSELSRQARRVHVRCGADTEY